MPKIFRTTDDKLTLIKALHRAPIADVLTDDYFFENIGAVINDEHLVQDAITWKNQCREKLGQWLRGKTVQITHHCSVTGEELPLDVVVIDVFNDKLTIHLVEPPSEWGLDQLRDFECVPTSFEAIINIQNWEEKYEAETGSPLYTGDPETNFELKVLSLLSLG